MGKSDAGTVWTVSACDGVTVTVSPDNVVSVKGPLGTLSQKVDSDTVVAAVIALGMNPQVEVDLCRRGKSQGPIGHR